MTIHETKLTIWNHPKIKQDAILLQSYADKAQVRLPITQQHEADKLLKLLNKKAKVYVYVSDVAHKRYCDAKYFYDTANFPNWCKDGHYMDPDKIKEDSNGLTNFIVNYLTWIGQRATRISVEGRVLQNGTRIKSSTRKGTADISSTIKGRSVMWEIKIGKDKASPAQLKEQSLERKAGGEYLFVKTADEFFYELDKLLVS